MRQLPALAMVVLKKRNEVIVTSRRQAGGRKLANGVCDRIRPFELMLSLCGTRMARSSETRYEQQAPSLR